jgi:transcriptional regulator with XRE-family HTH domain
MTAQRIKRAGGPGAKRLAVVVGNNVRALRQKRGLTQEAFKASFERTVLTKIELGTRLFTLVTLARLAAALRVEAWRLLRAKPPAATARKTRF